MDSYTPPLAGQIRGIEYRAPGVQKVMLTVQRSTVVPMRAQNHMNQLRAVMDKKEDRPYGDGDGGNARASSTENQSKPQCPHDSVLQGRENNARSFFHSHGVRMPTREKKKPPDEREYTSIYDHGKKKKKPPAASSARILNLELKRSETRGERESRATPPCTGPTFQVATRDIPSTPHPRCVPWA